MRVRVRARRRVAQGGDLHLGITVHMYIVICTRARMYTYMPALLECFSSCVGVGASAWACARVGARAAGAGVHYVSLCICMHVCTYVCMHASICVYMSAFIISLFECACVRVRARAQRERHKRARTPCVALRTYIWMHIYVYI